MIEAYIAMAYIVMAWEFYFATISSHGLHSYDPDSDGPYSDGLHMIEAYIVMACGFYFATISSCGLHSYGPYSDGLHIVMAPIVMAAIVTAWNLTLRRYRGRRP